MELLRDSILVSLAVSAAALYARTVSSLVKPGLCRLAMLLPVVVLFVAVPLGSSSAFIRCAAALYLAWLGTFKIILLALDSGPLDAGLPVLQFLLAAALPIELIQSHGHRDAARPKAEPVSLASCTFKVAAMAAIIHLYQYSNRLHLYMRLLLYGLHIWCSMELLSACAAAAIYALIGMEVKPQFNRPHLAFSLRDFWGRRWNLPVSAVLRASVYDPVRARAGKEAGILATFLVSGLMHEALVYYFILQPPTGEMAVYFILHGVCRVVEEWCARWWAARGWPPPPRPVATSLVFVFLTGTSFWLIFPSIYRDGREEMLLKELEAVAAFFARVGVQLLGTRVQ
ncbi:hypothetical protein SEVIR_6G016800v4 [Setaria viridis]|uniref:Wax synthase domain-containing protein n=1 Tax=Setaria viridis TaxID=4556 RepID=A0A4U6U4J8_SETVI|nr:probable long-chain-alcohol O-fatty-acyltransferase 1 [Setaria viridis]TKW08249.1 hypothetical protein SEVIR_6G016800v2 [Setaria viridis]